MLLHAAISYFHNSFSAEEKWRRVKNKKEQRKREGGKGKDFLTKKAGPLDRERDPLAIRESHLGEGEVDREFLFIGRAWGSKQIDGDLHYCESTSKARGLRTVLVYQTWGGRKEEEAKIQRQL